MQATLDATHADASDIARLITSFASDHESPHGGGPGGPVLAKDEEEDEDFMWEDEDFVGDEDDDFDDDDFEDDLEEDELFEDLDDDDEEIEDL